MATKTLKDTKPGDHFCREKEGHKSEIMRIERCAGIYIDAAFPEGILVVVLSSGRVLLLHPETEVFDIH